MHARERRGRTVSRPDRGAVLLLPLLLLLVACSGKQKQHEAET
jgi:hypothetical protein